MIPLDLLLILASFPPLHELIGKRRKLFSYLLILLLVWTHGWLLSFILANRRSSKLLILPSLIRLINWHDYLLARLTCLQGRILDRDNSFANHVY